MGLVDFSLSSSPKNQKAIRKRANLPDGLSSVDTEELYGFRVLEWIFVESVEGRG